MELTSIERMLFQELLARQQEVVAPIQKRIDEAVAAVAGERGIPPEACRVDLGTGQVLDVRETERVMKLPRGPGATEEEIRAAMAAQQEARRDR